MSSIKRYTQKIIEFIPYIQRMKNIATAGRILYGIGIAGIGVLHFFYAGFRPVILPVTPEATQQVSVLVYITGALLTGAGLAIAAGFKTNLVALLLAIILLLFVLFGHLPNRLMNMPAILGAWTDALKLLALSGGAFIIAETCNHTSRQPFIKNLDRFAFLGRYFFGLMLFIFGIDHFVYADFVKILVPLWIPGPVFWTYFAGIAPDGCRAGISY